MKKMKSPVVHSRVRGMWHPCGETVSVNWCSPLVSRSYLQNISDVYGTDRIRSSRWELVSHTETDRLNISPWGDLSAYSKYADFCPRMSTSRIVSSEVLQRHTKNVCYRYICNSKQLMSTHRKMVIWHILTIRCQAAIKKKNSSKTTDIRRCLKCIVREK